jgi:hypothetical protein
MIRRTWLAPCLLVVGFAILSGQTPAPSAPAAKPLRHLEYTFSAHEEGMSGFSYNGINGGVETGSGVGTDQVADGAEGTMSVDVISIAPDGALNVQISEKVQQEARPRQAFTCAVYGNTSVLCPEGPAPSEAEYVLMSFLGRQFVDGAPWDAQNHWQRKYQITGATVTEDFKLADVGDGKHVKINEVRKTELHAVGFASQTEEVTITYDRSMEVPVAINAVAQSSSEGGTDHATFDYTLLRDSFTKP